MGDLSKLVNIIIELIQVIIFFHLATLQTSSFRLISRRGMVVRSCFDVVITAAAVSIWWCKLVFRRLFGLGCGSLSHDPAVGARFWFLES